MKTHCIQSFLTQPNRLVALLFSGLLLIGLIGAHVQILAHGAGNPTDKRIVEVAGSLG